MKLQERKLGSVPQFVAEVSISFDAIGVQVDIATTTDIVAERETKGVCATLRDALGKVFSLACLRLGNFLWVEIALKQLSVKLIQRRTIDNVDRIDDIAERLGHLASVSIPNEGVAEDLFKWHLSCKFDTEENHSSDPEGDNIPACLENAGWVEAL